VRYARVALKCVTVATIASLLLFNVTDIGISLALAKLWSIKGA
jgi:hypothetical protein